MKILGFDVTTLYAFALSLLAALASLFTADPHVVAVLHEVSSELLIIGGVLHLDKTPNFHLDADTLFAFATAFIGHLANLFVNDPKWSPIITQIANGLTLVGAVFHLDNGNINTTAAPVTTAAIPNQ